jgi:predicted transcriptional regulator
MGDGAKVAPSPDALSALLSSSNKADLLVLFHRNPGLIDTVDGIAKRLGKRGSAIAPDLSELTSTSILQKKTVGKSEVYFLNREKDKESQKEIAEYITNLGGKKQ